MRCVYTKENKGRHGILYVHLECMPWWKERIASYSEAQDEVASEVEQIIATPYTNE